MAEQRELEDRRRTDIDQRLLDSNPQLWTRILKVDHQVRSVANWGLQVSDAHSSHPCDENCERWLPDPSVIEKCVNYMDAFFHVCKNVDIVRANQLAAIALMFLSQNFSLTLQYLESAAKRHHGQHGCRLPWCLDIN